MMTPHTPRFTDSHCHLAEDDLFFRLPEILAEAKRAGVCRFAVPAVRRRDWDRVCQLARLPETALAALGLHPWFVHAPDDLADLDDYLRREPALWVGETGLDFHRAATAAERDTQTQLFAAQLDLAQQHRRPIILHQVRAAEAVFRQIRRTGFTQGGIAHAFSGSLETEQILLKQGFKIGIGMLLLNPNAKKLHRTAAALPPSALLLETDSPFMLHGQINTPANVRRVAEALARLRGCTLAEIAAQTEANFNEIST
nr:TatD family hydrolase [Conchiformibius kuhniae]